jgi:putative heme iron utilization protein
MSSSSVRKHAGVASDQPTVPEPSFAERARTLLYVGRIGSLSTLSRKQPGFPFGSVMPHGLHEHGRPIFLISTMAMHTQNLQADPSRQPACDTARRQRRSARLVQGHVAGKCSADTGVGGTGGA